jgi:RNA polymerase sigma-70 factor, ECF subfamily
MLEQEKYRYLIKQYKNKIFTYSLYMLKNKMDADDVSQEVFIRIWKNIDSVNAFASKAWIMKTTHNLCIDLLRKKSSALSRELEFDEEIVDMIEHADSNNEIQNKAHFGIIGEKIKIVIENLPYNLKSVFILYELHNLKYREISQTLGIPVNSVKVYLLRARKKLQYDLRMYQNEG